MTSIQYDKHKDEWVREDWEIKGKRQTLVFKKIDVNIKTRHRLLKNRC